MGLAERFKEKLDKVQEPKVYLVKDEITPVKKQNNYAQEQIMNSLVQKIKNTPYWNDYSLVAQKKMIVKYFDSKLEKNTDIPYSISNDEKLSFLDLILEKIK
jgi:hypothetical protein